MTLRIAIPMGLGKGKLPATPKMYINYIQQKLYEIKLLPIDYYFGNTPMRNWLMNLKPFKPTIQGKQVIIDMMPLSYNDINYFKQMWVDAKSKLYRLFIPAYRGYVDKWGYPVANTDWNQEAELLKEYLAYCIEYRFKEETRKSDILYFYKNFGYLILETGLVDFRMLTFEQWKKQKKGLEYFRKGF